MGKSVVLRIRRKPAKHAGAQEERKVTVAVVLTAMFVRPQELRRSNRTMLVAPKGSKFSERIPAEIGKRQPRVQAEEPTPAPYVADEHGFLEVHQPAMA